MIADLWFPPSNAKYMSFVCTSLAKDCLAEGFNYSLYVDYLSSLVTNDNLTPLPIDEVGYNKLGALHEN